MSQAGFLQALEQFPKDSINDEICELMQPYFDSEDYSQESAKRVCIHEVLFSFIFSIPAVLSD